MIGLLGLGWPAGGELQVVKPSFIVFTGVLHHWHYSLSSATCQISDGIRILIWMNTVKCTCKRSSCAVALNENHPETTTTPPITWIHGNIVFHEAKFLVPKRLGITDVYGICHRLSYAPILEYALEVLTPRTSECDYLDRWILKMQLRKMRSYRWYLEK